MGLAGGAFAAQREDDDDLFKYISFEIFPSNLIKSLDSVGIETSSSALSALSAFSGCKFWLEDIKFK